VLFCHSPKNKIPLPAEFSHIIDTPGDSNAVVLGCNPKRERRVRIGNGADSRWVKSPSFSWSNADQGTEPFGIRERVPPASTPIETRRRESDAWQFMGPHW
jgi:hypothetical protein